MRYQLRNAAGIYWLLDTEQEGVPYKKPLTMNEVGADIWRMLERGLKRDQIADTLCRKYGVPQDVILPDVEQFLTQLGEYGINMA